VASPRRASIPADVRREVWARDDGRCTWLGRDGRRCGSRWKLEIDHVQPDALGGTFDPGNLRLLCRAHNLLHARNVFGEDGVTERIARHRRSSVGASLIPG
jgi:5-methylcytosine-specific restriction endonuclease McrA